MLHIRALLVTFLLASLGTALAGQDAPEARLDARVKVSLHNGALIVGIAREGVLCERQGRGGFESIDDRSQRGAGIRVWFYQRMNGFLFVPHRQVREIEILATLTPEQSASLQREISTKSGAETAAASPGRKVEGASSAPTGVPGREVSWAPTGPDPDPDPASRRASLLEEYPPSKGWGKDRLGEIRRREILEDIRPTAEERRFVEVYEEWDRAFRESEKPSRATPPTEPSPPPTEVPKNLR